ncbi:unnamed protein product [Oppiella nova]|uniref:non-specific serine/threonine protein kinase n=1 Tax=Oppiella nova TaxID=334625 RepID=A0A7R9M088_9ACAR|nr:unnamed protein product [Oppiella nova]CAG2168080.1 unnamed protein product [Oppiella nova]
MWTQLEQFMICDNIPQRDKENVVLLHVFKQYNEDTEIVAGCNFFYATNDDSVYGFGDNIHGCLGLGHNRAVDTPQLIPELCGKSFKQFVIGYDFVLAITDGNQIYSWGHNNRGQLTREITPSVAVPNTLWPSALMDRCTGGGSHAITRDGHVFSWGVNTHNQLVTNGTLKRDYVIGNQIDVGSGLCADKSIYKSQYDELSQIGSGGFGTVFKVKHKCDGELYAIKKMNINVRSEYVVQYYSSWIERNELYIQMELCCYNLQNILEVKPQVFGRQLGQPMDCVEYFILCEIFRQILESVQYLHELNPQIIHRDLKPENILIAENIIHRDLKPENILIAENVRNDRFVKLCDFGLAIVHDKRYNSPTSKKHTSDVGTIKYQAPEVNHSEKYGHKADIYSLALIGGDIFELDLYKQESKR